MNTAVERAYAVLSEHRECLGLEPIPRQSRYRSIVRIAYEQMTDEQLGRHLSSRVMYDQVRKSAALLLRQGGELSPPLRAFVADVLEGKKPPAKTKEPDRLLIWVIGAAVLAAKEVTGVYRNDATSSRDSACDAVAEAAGLLGVTLTYDKVAHRFRDYLALNS